MEAKRIMEQLARRKSVTRWSLTKTVRGLETGQVLLPVQKHNDSISGWTGHCDIPAPQRTMERWKRKYFLEICSGHEINVNVSNERHCEGFVIPPAPRVGKTYLTSLLCVFVRDTLGHSDYLNFRCSVDHSHCTHQLSTGVGRRTLSQCCQNCRKFTELHVKHFPYL